METGEVARVTVSYNITNGSTAQNVFYMQLASGGISDATALTDIDNWVNAGWLDEWDNIAIDESEGTGFDADIMDLATSTFGHVLRNLGGASYTTHTGTLTSEILPAGVAGLLVAPTGAPKVRGRKFVPGIGEGSSVDGLFSTETVDALLALGLYLINTYVNGSNSYVMGVLSTSLLDFEPFAGSVVASDVPSYQRRRKPGVGI